MKYVFTPATLRMLQSNARARLARFRFNGPVLISWTDDTTASTDGVHMWIPRSFENIKLDGQKLTKTQTRVAVALELHETGHYLQPLAECGKIARTYGLPHVILNLLLDVHLESVWQVHFYQKEARYNLGYLRLLVKRNSRAEWLAEWAQHNQDFADEFIYSFFLARFNSGAKPFSPSRKFCEQKRTRQCMAFIRKFFCCGRKGGKPALLYPPAQLPALVTEFCSRFPELLNRPDLDAMPTPGDYGSNRCEDSQNDAENQVMSGSNLDGQGNPTLTQQVAWIAQEANSALALHTINLPRGNAQKKSGAIAARLRSNFDRALSVDEITAPVDIIRRPYMMGADVFYKMDVDSDQAIKRHAVIALDISGSMDAVLPDGTPRWQECLTAAQAIAMATQNEDGRITAVLFNHSAYVDPSEGSGLFFAKNTGVYAGGGTCFTFLTEVWRRWTTSPVIVITDGGGALPNVIRASDHARTYVICIGDGCDLSASGALGTVIHLPNAEGLTQQIFDIIN